MNVELTRIAQKKLEQMGATVHGVLAKNEAGAWVAVSEAGRVMWLDNFEGRDSSVQPEQPSAGVVPEGWRLVPIESTSEMDLAAEDADLERGRARVDTRQRPQVAGDLAEVRHDQAFPRMRAFGTAHVMP